MDRDRCVRQDSLNPAPHGGVLLMPFVISPSPRARFISTIQRKFRICLVLPGKPSGLRQPNKNPGVGLKAYAEGDAKRRGMTNVGTRHLEVVRRVSDIVLIPWVEVNVFLVGVALGKLI